MPPPVKAPFSLFLAFRYLKPKRTFVSVITALSVLGVTLGITVLIVGSVLLYLHLFYRGRTPPRSAAA